ncbi:MAG TPA: zf-HC2 domain-containing protein [Micromonosporaceae bacterium]|nr:zf-HC2 domain-containing protein [Micromonosporaceae bacterium]
MRCEYANEDGVYVLGALSPAERAVYERHLARCPSCWEAVADLAVLPGLLGRLDPATAEQIAQAGAPTEPDRLPRLLAVARADRARQRLRWRASLAAFAACLVAVVAIEVGTWGKALVDQPDPVTPVTPVTLVAMTPVSGSGALAAEVGITGTTGGTLVTVHCSYRSYPSTERRRPYTFRLHAVAVDGTSEQVASWSAAAGDDLRFEGLTRIDQSNLDRIELRRADGAPILVYSLR